MKRLPTLPDIFFQAQKHCEDMIPALADYFGCSTDLFGRSRPTSNVLRHEATTPPPRIYDLRQAHWYLTHSVGAKNAARVREEELKEEDRDIVVYAFAYVDLVRGGTGFHDEDEEEKGGLEGEYRYVKEMRCDYGKKRCSAVYRGAQHTLLSVETHREDEEKNLVTEPALLIFSNHLFHQKETNLHHHAKLALTREDFCEAVTLLNYPDPTLTPKEVVKRFSFFGYGDDLEIEVQIIAPPKPQKETCRGLIVLYKYRPNSTERMRIADTPLKEFGEEHTLKYKDGKTYTLILSLPPTTTKAPPVP